MFVYKTTCLINNKKYIGKYEGSEDKEYLGSGKLLKRVIDKYGKDNFTREILERFTDKKSCQEGEKYWIKKFNAVESDDYYNISRGGDGGDTFAGINGAEKENLLLKLKHRPNIGKHLLKNSTCYMDLRSGIISRYLKSEYDNNHFLVGSVCKGIYKTPFGNFSSLAKAQQYLGLDSVSIRNRCLKNERKIFKGHLQSLDPNSLIYRHTKDSIGKLFKDVGFDFIPISKLIGSSDSEILNLNIIR